MLLTTLMNGIFVCYGLSTSLSGLYSTSFMNNASIVLGICEVILYGNILLSRVLFNLLLLLRGLLTNRSTFTPCKVIAQELRSLSTLSILRYMPSIELVTSMVSNWRETAHKVEAEFRILCTHKRPANGRASRKKHARYYCKILWRLPVYVVETFAPFLALFAMLVKIKELEFAIEDGDDPFVRWGIMDCLTFLAFLNQVAGLRVLRKVETASIQHFVFSGSDAQLNTKELLLMESWWNITLLSAASSLHLRWWDNMVFWFSLSPQVCHV